MVDREWPTQDRLAELRGQGIVLSTRLVNTAVAAMAVLISLFILRNEITDLVDGLSFILTDDLPEIDGYAAQVASLSPQFFRLLLVPPIVALLMVLLASLLQTRFMIAPARLRLNMSRLAMFAQRRDDHTASRSLFFLILSLLGLLSGAALVFLKLPSVLELLNNDSDFVISWAARFFPGLLPFLLVVLLFVAVLFWFLERFAFLVRHRMTRAEVLEEAQKN